MVISLMLEMLIRMTTLYILFNKNGQHLSGLPKKQHKRIKNLADYFKFENEKLFYRKNI